MVLIKMNLCVVLILLLFVLAFGPLLIEGFPRPVSTRHTRNMSHDIRGDPVILDHWGHGGVSSWAA